MSIAIGQHFERSAQNYLESQGLKLITQNFRCKLGEIDLIMKDNDFLVFVEVRYRSQRTYGSAIESIHFKKQQRLIRAAQVYLQSKNLFDKIPCRFDVIAIDSKNKTSMEWIKNAFSS